VIRAVHLHGSLGRRFGPRFDLAVETPAEAIRALTHMLRGFREAIAGASWRVVRGRFGLEPDALGLKMGACRELHVVPAPTGRKNAGVGKIIAGVVLIAAAVVTAGMALAAAPAAGGFAAGTLGAAGGVSGLAGASAIGVTGVLTVGQLAFLGVGMVLTGASMLLSPQPKPASGPLAVDQKESFMFSGPVNSNAQGGPVPLVYGRIRVGSIVTASALKAEDYVAYEAPAPPSGTMVGKLVVQAVGRT
jgi:predicted phage tail protein